VAQETTDILMYQCLMPSGSVGLCFAPLLVLLGLGGARGRELFSLLRDALSTSHDGGYVAVRDLDCPDDAVAQDVQSAAFVTRMKVAQPGPSRGNVPQQPQATATEEPGRFRGNKLMPQAKLLLHHWRKRRRAASKLMVVSKRLSASKAKALSGNVDKGTVDDDQRTPGRGGIVHWLIDTRSHENTWFKLQIVTSFLISLVCCVACCLIYVECSTKLESPKEMGFDDTCEYGEPDSIGKDDCAGRELGSSICADAAEGEPNQKEAKMDHEIN